MSELQTLLDKAARARSQGVVAPTPKAEVKQAKIPETKSKGGIHAKIKKRMLVGAICIIALASIGLYFFLRTPGTSDVANLVAAVGKEITLPVNETPTVATVTDPEQLASQAFFKDAQVGDKVLIYSHSGKAILYRPSEKKIIAIGPLITGK